MDDNGRNDCFMSNALCLSLPAAVWEYLSWLQFLVRRMEIQRNALKSKRRHTHDPYFASLPVFCGADLSVFKYFLSVINHHVWACKWLFVILYGKTWKSNKSCGHTCAEKKTTLAWKLEGQRSKATCHQIDPPVGQADDDMPTGLWHQPVTRRDVNRVRVQNYKWKRLKTPYIL